MVRAEFTGGLPANSKIGFHIHTDAFDGADCSSTGGHYNPQGVDHGAWFNQSDMRHVGDFKQLWADQAGAASYRYQDNQASLYETDDRYDLPKIFKMYGHSSEHCPMPLYVHIYSAASLGNEEVGLCQNAGEK